MYTDKNMEGSVKNSCGSIEVRNTLSDCHGFDTKRIRNALDKSRIKLVVSDLDGTLLRSDERLDLNISSEIKNKPYLFTIASGRNKALIKNYIEDLNIEIPYIANNGAEIIFENRTIYQRNIVRKDLMYMLKLAKTMEIECLINCDQYVYTMGYINHMKKLVERFDGILPRLRDAALSTIGQDEVQKIMFYHNQGSILQGFASLVNKKCANTICSKAEGDFYCAKHLEADKGTALEKLCSMLEIDLDEVLVFGDNYNDLGMFRAAKYSVVTENAEKIVKNNATFITKANDENGVSYFLKNMWELI